jgi:2-polyprenyl-3-methyl-5-hydroxy-6-metoxy-1,4-benzoquinol methylase
MNYREKLYKSYVSSDQARVSYENVKSIIRLNSPYVLNLIKNFFPTQKNILIFDLGCGYGKFLYAIKKKGYHNIRGVDISQEQVSIANHLGLSEIVNNDISFFLNNQYDSPDLILMMDILEHFTKNELFELLDLVFKKLKNNGRLIVHVPNAEGVFGNRIIYGDLSHEIAFTPSSICQVLKIVGFRIVSVYEDKPIVHGLFSFFRRVIWEIGSFPIRILLFSETGNSKMCLSQNMTIVANK